MKIHVFHFVLSGELKKAIELIAEKLGFNISKTILYMIKITAVLLDHFRYFHKEKMNEYPEVGWDKHIQVYMNKDEYRKLKEVHDTMNTFSIAVVLRAIIVFFVEGVEEFGLEEFLKKMNKYDAGTFYKFIRTRKWEKQEIPTQLRVDDVRIPDVKFTFNCHFQCEKIIIQ